MARELFLISETLPAILKSLEEALGVRFSEREIQRMFVEAEADQVSQKCYTFFHSPRMSVAGAVDEYEPETVWIEVTGSWRHQRAFQGVVDERRLLLGPHRPIH